MTQDTLGALQLYLRLLPKEKLRFLNEVYKIETMHPAVRSDYEKTLLSIASETKKDDA